MRTERQNCTGESQFALGVIEKEKSCGAPDYMPEPKWATDLIEEVCGHYNRRRPPVKWVKRKGSYSTGTTYRKRIVLRMGSRARRIDRQNLLLHELAHYLSPWGWHHSVKFWVKCWEMYYLFGDELTAKKSEFRYMKKARQGYYKYLAKG